MEASENKREYNMDILRCLLIFFVIVLHYNNRGMGGALNYAAVGGVKEAFLRFTESLSICAVDGFLMLSGYFAGNKTKTPYKKAVWLLVACSFYRTVSYILHAALVIHEFHIRTLISYIIPSNWFVCMFVAVLLLSPFIDRLIKLLGNRQLNELVLVISGLFVLVPTLVSVGGDLAGVDLSGLATISISGDAEGFTIVSMIYCYIMGYYIRKQKAYFDNISRLSCLIIFFLAAALAASISYRTEAVWSYSDILTVLEAMALMVFFSKCRLDKDIPGKFFSAVGGCGLGIFVWHTSPLMIYGFWVHFDIPSIGEKSIGGYALNLLGAAVAMYLASAVWVYICRRLSGFIQGKFNK